MAVGDLRTTFVNAKETQLTTQFGPTDLTAIVDQVSPITSPVYVVIDPDDNAKREYVKFDGTFTATNLVTGSIGNRYLAGSAAGSGITHEVGAVVRIIMTAQHFDDIWDAMVAEEAARTAAVSAEASSRAAADAALGALISAEEAARIAADAAESAARIAAAAAHVALPNAHHAQAHAFGGADHTGALSFAKMDASTVEEFIIVSPTTAYSDETVLGPIGGDPFVTLISDTVSVPATWTTYTLLAWFSGVIHKTAGMPAADELDVRLVIDTVSERSRTLNNIGVNIPGATRIPFSIVLSGTGTRANDTTPGLHFGYVAAAGAASFNLRDLNSTLIAIKRT